MKVAIVHDFLSQYGGAEKVIEVFNGLFPDAPIFTPIYVQNKLPPIFKEMNIKASFMQKFPFLDKNFKKYLIFYPKAIESFDLSNYDLILSSSSSFAKGAIKDKNAYHICYCYTPMRYICDYRHYIEKENFNSSKIVENASRFDTDIFKKNIVDFINQKYKDYTTGNMS